MISFEYDILTQFVCVIVFIVLEWFGCLFCYPFQIFKWDFCCAAPSALEKA